MMNRNLVYRIFLLGQLFGPARAQVPNPVLPPELTQKSWSAQWITVAGEPARGYGVYHFRKQISVDRKPDTFVIHVSGDNRRVRSFAWKGLQRPLKAGYQLQTL